MAINASTYIPVTSTVANTIPNKKVFAGLALSANSLIPTTNPILKFTSAAAVSTYFGSSSNEALAAKAYFTSYTSSKAIPPYMYFGKYIYQAIAPYLRSGVIKNSTTTLATLRTITSGNMTVTVNGTAYATTGIDLSAATNMSLIASTLTTDIVTANTALNSSGLNFTITWDSVNLQFVAAIPATGSTDTMNYFSSTTSTPNLANTLQFTLATNAVLSQGSDIQTPAQNMATLLTHFSDQFSIFFVDTMSGGLTDAVDLGVSTWVDSQGDNYNFFLWSNEVALESSTDTTSIWYQVTSALLNNTSFFDEVVYNNSLRAAAASGIFASIDLTQPNSAITLAFKTQTGLLTSVSDTSVSEILDTKKINYYGNIGISGTTQQVNWFYGSFTTGKWAYIDNQVAAVWTQVQLQIVISAFFGQVPQIPNDPAGDTQVRSLITGVAEANIVNGIIAKGLTFDTATNQALIAQGISPQELTNNGYVILKNPTSQSDRQDRASSPWTLAYTKASGVQLLPITAIQYY